MPAAPSATVTNLRWTAVVLALTAPILILICLDIWRMPMPVSEAVALFEDVVNQPPSRFLTPDTSYWRPLYHLSVGAIWRELDSVETRLAAVRLMQIVPFALLVLLVIAHLRPLTLVDAAAATVAVAVLLGSPGLRDNLEIPLSYTTVGMPLIVLAWMLATSQRRAWTGIALIAIAIVATGFKEQGLVVVSIITIAWMMRAPGVSRWVVAVLVCLTGAYVAYRLAYKGSWPMFEQAIGIGFTEIEPVEAEARYGSFPYWLYAYSSMATVLNIFFSEPTRGTFRIIRDLSNGYTINWQINTLFSATAITALIFWWGTGTLRRAWREGWSAESRMFVALIVAALSCGVLSFNYSRDRLGGMATPFYAMAAFYAMRAAILYISGGSLARWPDARHGPAPQTQAGSSPSRRKMVPVAAALALMLVAGAWHIRAISTLESVRLMSYRNQRGWFVELERRRLEFAERQTYLNIMHSMLEQGIAPGAPRHTRYPPQINELLALP